MRLRVVVATLAVATVALVARVTPAFADYQSHPLYQIAISANCNNPSVCGADQLGGFWGWAVFNTDGTADAEFTGCGHLQHGGGPGTAGAGHIHVDVEHWFIGKNGNFWTEDETDTSVGRGGSSTTFTAAPQDTDVPAKAGHYNTAEVLGFTAPGVSFQLQVVLIPQNGKFSSAGSSSSSSVAAVGTGGSATSSGAAFGATQAARGLVLTRFGWIRLSNMGHRLVV
jgi:hypothetical protein